jgi:hypothetical protein
MDDPTRRLETAGTECTLLFSRGVALIRMVVGIGPTRITKGFLSDIAQYESPIRSASPSDAQYGLADMG